MKTADISSEYDRIYSTHGLRANTAYYKWIVSLLKVKKGNFLDIACGEGVLLKELKKSNPNVQTYGFDISAEACKLARKDNEDSFIFVGDGHRLPFKDYMFDCVACLGSLEHFLDPAAGVREIVRVLKLGGAACIVLPNSFSIDVILEVIFKGDDTSAFQIIERRATKNKWVEFLEDNGLKVNRIYKSNLWPEFFQEGTYKIKSVAKFIKRLIVKYFCPLNLTREFVFICSKK